MRNLDPALAARLAAPATTLCHCWKLIRRDGTILGFTDHDRDLSVDGQLYATPKALTAGAIENSLGLAAGAAELSGALESDALLEDDLVNGLYDGATIELWLVDWTLPEKPLLVDVGTIGEVRRSEYAFTAEWRSLAHELDQERGRTFQLACSADLGDTRCGVDLTASQYSATAQISGLIDEFTISTHLPDFASGWFASGRLTFTSGGNAGTSLPIKGHWTNLSGAVLSFWAAPAKAMAVGDAFTVQAGCDKSFAACRDKFANRLNFRGFPQMPLNDKVLSYPASGDEMDGGSLLQ
jgi:uncharacterized phage protein (TIGR02218 family)